MFSHILDLLCLQGVFGSCVSPLVAGIGQCLCIGLKEHGGGAGIF